MEMLKKLVYTLLLTLLLSFIITTAFTFFGIGVEAYGNYLLWMIALALFFSILPGKVASVFN
jgi:hypothetical protein